MGDDFVSKNFKRIVAYMLDMFLVTAIVFALTNIKQVNFQLDSHDKVAKEYSEIAKKYEKQEKKFNKVKKKYEKKKVSKSEYKESEKEFKKQKKEYAENIKKYNYKLSKTSVFSTVMSMLVVVIYFGFFQYFMGGQTLGKKLMKIKVVKNKPGELNVFHFILRCIILNGVIANLLLVIFVYIFSAGDFYNIAYIVSNCQSIIEFIIIIMVFMTSDNRGLHDYIANTKVVELDALGNIIVENKVEEVKEAEIIDEQDEYKSIKEEVKKIETKNNKKSSGKKKKEVNVKNKKNKKEEL